MESVNVNDTLEEELDLDVARSKFEQPQVFNKIGEDEDKENIIHEYEPPVVIEKPNPQGSLFAPVEEPKIEIVMEEKTNEIIFDEIKKLKSEVEDIKEINTKNNRILAQIRDIFGELLLQMKN